MGQLKGQHEQFCRLVAEGLSATKAYAETHPGTNSLRTSSKAASNLLKKPEIAARVAELRAVGAEKVGDTIATMAAQLDEDRKFAREQNSPSAAVAATVAKAKLLGLYVEKKDVQIGMRPGEAQQIIAYYTERHAKGTH